MTVTRHPTGADLICLVCGKQAQDIDHVVNRGMGGSKARDIPENKVPLCRDCHELKTVGRIETKVMWDRLGRVYLWRRKGADVWVEVPVEVSERYKCLVGRLSAAAEDSAGEYVLAAQAQGNAPGEKRQHDKPRPSSAAAPSAGEKEEGDGVVGLDTYGTGDSADAARRPVGKSTQASSPDKSPSVRRSVAADGSQHGSVSHSSVLTHEQRVVIAQEIKDTEWNRQFRAGDTANQWRDELGEEAEQYISDFGYVQESIANIMRVCTAIPKALRSASLRFSHHVVVADLNLEDMDEWLGTCEIEHWSVAEFRRQVKGTKPKVKRWTLAELRTLVPVWESAYEYTGGEDPIDDLALWKFLDWLEEGRGDEDRS